MIVAVELLLTLVKAYLTTGLGVILLGFGGNRFTACASEGYFTNVIRIGVKLLFFYAVLAIGMQMVTQWEAALAAACKPVTTAVPMITSYYVPPISDHDHRMLRHDSTQRHARTTRRSPLYSRLSPSPFRAWRPTSLAARSDSRSRTPSRPPIQLRPSRES